jgi:hypothetical protein
MVKKVIIKVSLYNLFGRIYTVITITSEKIMNYGKTYE